MKGCFEIECVRRPDGVTAIGRRNVSAPWHLSKPYWDGRVLLVQSVNMTAGVFAGDTLRLDVRVAEQASVLLTSPSASRIHTMREGEASLVQHVHVAPGAWLEWMPELFIPQRMCRYRQQTRIDVETGGSLFAVETLAPGRVAHGEVFAFDRVVWSTQLRYAGKLILSERYPLSPEDRSLHDLNKSSRPRYFAGAMLVHRGLPPVRTLQESLTAGADSDLYIGVTSLHEDVVLIRLLSESSPTLKNALSGIRASLSALVPALASSPRKL